jgi:DNA modification methylase
VDFTAYRRSGSRRPLLLRGEAEQVLAGLPEGCIDCCMTSPPYWGKREYAGGGIGLEPEYADYLSALLRVLRQVHRVLKPTGSLWLNLGDSYLEKNLLGIPWRVAIALTEQQGWVLRNDIIWHKVKGGPDNARDKLRNTHEHLFHLVKQRKGYYYDDTAVRRRPREARVVNGAVVSATGVSGVRYQRQIQLSTALSPEEKQQALAALREVLSQVAEGRLADFRLVLRRQQRATHSDSGQVSGRARELQQRGFYFLKYHPDGSKLGDVWDILPEDTQRRSGHFAPYPEELCRIPILATCPPDGLVLDPFVGTGTTCLVATRLRRQSVGVDLAPEYLQVAAQRCEAVLP